MGASTPIKGGSMSGKTRCWITGTAVGVAASALMAASMAVASGVSTVSDTQIIKNQVLVSEATTQPCSGMPGTHTLVARNAVAHVTFNANGFWATFTAEGWASFTPNDPSQPSGLGRFTVWDGENGNLKNATETATFRVRVRFSDGSVVIEHEVVHMSISANGINSISFDKPRLTCG